MKKFLLFLGIALFLSCEKDNFCGCYIVDIGVNISITDSNGNDLLNPENSNAYTEKDIKLFISDQGQMKEVLAGNTDYPGDLMIFPTNNSKYMLRVFTPQPVTYIQWKGTDMDTIQCEFSQTDNSKICTKVWYNSKLVFDGKNGTGRYFEIKK